MSIPSNIFIYHLLSVNPAIQISDACERSGLAIILYVFWGLFCSPVYYQEFYFAIAVLNTLFGNSVRKLRQK